MKFVDRWNNVMFIWSNGLLEILPKALVGKISPESNFEKFKLILKDIIADFLRLFKTTMIPKSRVWFFVLTQNNYEALKQIKQKVPDSIYVSFFRFRSSINDDTYYFHLSRRFFYDLIYPFKLLIYYNKNKKKAKRYFDLLLTVNGSYEECLRLIKKNKPKAIVFTNDHLIMSRSLLLAANKLGVKTYYIQHASVTEYFPPLEFTFALLEGEDAYLKYKRCGQIKSKVHLVGMSKFDGYMHQMNSKNKLETLGIAFNLIDDISLIRNFINDIIEKNKDLEIILRPHPADQRNLLRFRDVNISDSNKENSFEFIKKIDCLVSGDSSIHLEAVLLNVYSCYFKFDESKTFDYYKYVKNGLVEHFKDIESLDKRLKELQLFKPYVQNKATYYNAAIGTEFYGRTTIKISNFIMDTIND